MSNLCLIQDTELEIAGDEMEIYYCSKLITTLTATSNMVIIPELKLPYYDYVVKSGGQIVECGTAFTKRAITK